MYLIDTHALLWFVEGDPRLSKKAEELIRDDENQIFLSSISLFEMAIKVGMGQLYLHLDRDFSQYLEDFVYPNDIQILPIEPDHLNVFKKLPFHHKDPFDRLIISQALSEGFEIITKDSEFPAYGVGFLW